MQGNIIKELNDVAPYISEQDLDIYIPGLLELYNNKIYYLAKKAYGNNSVGLAAFKELAKGEIKRALNTFIFSSELWKYKRDINPYLLTCLNRLGDKVVEDVNVIQRTNIPICPVAKLDNLREFLIEEDNLLKSNYCIDKLIELEKENSNNESLKFFYKTFAYHSKKGYKCCNCQKFIPLSAAINKEIVCPYLDCNYIGNVKNLKHMAHPVSSKLKSMNSLQELLYNDGSCSIVKQDTIEDKNTSPDAEISLSDRFNTEFKILNDVIKEQISLIKRTNSSKTLQQKLLMYEAFETMTNNLPYEMTSYLVHRKQNAEFPIQSRIFQEYVKLVQDELPIEIVKGGKTHTIVSLTDPLLCLFTGVSEYEAIVDENETIPNNTKELYIGERQFKCYGSCFIGKLIDIVDQNTGNSLLEKVIEYSFMQIKIANVEPGTPVVVKHFRIPSHYEMGSLVYLQRTRKKIVDKVYFKLNGKKRQSGE